MLLGVDAHEEGGHVDRLLADADVALLDQHARVVNRLGQVRPEHLGLQPPLQKLTETRGNKGKKQLQNAPAAECSRRATFFLFRRDLSF